MHTYTASEAADRAGISRQAIALYCRKGIISARRFGTQWMIDEVDFRQWLSRRRRPGWEKGRPRKVPLTEEEKRAIKAAARQDTTPSP